MDKDLASARVRKTDTYIHTHANKLTRKSNFQTLYFSHFPTQYFLTSIAPENVKTTRRRTHFFLIIIKQRAPTGGDMNSQMAAMQQQQQKKAQMEEMKKAVLKTLLTPDARARLASVKLVKPGKAASLENYLVQNSKNLLFQF